MAVRCCSSIILEPAGGLSELVSARNRVRRLWDLNCISFSKERTSADSPIKRDHRNSRIEEARRTVTLVPAMRKPFDALAEGLVSEKSRGDKTPLELFLAGARALALESRIVRILPDVHRE